MDLRDQSVNFSVEIFSVLMGFTEVHTNAMLKLVENTVANCWDHYWKNHKFLSITVLKDSSRSVPVIKSKACMKMHVHQYFQINPLNVSKLHPSGNHAVSLQTLRHLTLKELNYLLMWSLNILLLQTQARETIFLSLS